MIWQWAHLEGRKETAWPRHEGVRQPSVLPAVGKSVGWFWGEAVSRARPAPLLVTELEGYTVQWVPQLQPAVTAAQAFAPVPLALPTGPGTQLYPAWVGDRGQELCGSPLGLLPSSPAFPLTNEVVGCAQVIVPYRHQQGFLGQLLPRACIEEFLQGRGQEGRRRWPGVLRSFRNRLTQVSGSG